MASRDVIHEAVLQLRADTTQLRSDLAAGRSMFEGSLKGLQGLARSLVPVLSIGGIAALGKNLLDLGDQLSDLHDKTGLSIEVLGGLKPMIDQTDSSIDQFATGILKAQKNLGGIQSAADPAALALKSMGLNLQEMMSATPDEFLEKFAKGLATVEDRNKRAALATQILGKAGAELIPILLKIAERGLTRLSEEATAGYKVLGKLKDRMVEIIGISANFMAGFLGSGLGGQIKTLDGQIAGLTQRMEKLQDSSDGAIQKMFGQLKAQRDALIATRDALKGPLAETTPPKTEGTDTPGPDPRKIQSATESLQKQIAALEGEAKAVTQGEEAGRRWTQVHQLMAELGVKQLPPAIQKLVEKINDENEAIRTTRLLLEQLFGAYDRLDQETQRLKNEQSEDEKNRQREIQETIRLLEIEQNFGVFDRLDQESREQIQRMQKNAQDVGRTMEELRTRTSVADLDALTFGASFDALPAKLDAVRDAMHRMNEIIAEGGPAADLASAKIASLKDQLGSLESMKRLEDSVGRVFDSISNGIEQTMQGIMQGTQSLGEGLQNMLRNVMLSINQELTKMLIIEPLKEKLMGLVRGLMLTGETKPPGALEQLSGPGMEELLWGKMAGEGGGFDLSKIFSGITEKLSSMMSGLMDTLSSALSGLGNMFSSMFSGIGSFIMGMFDKGGFVGLGGLPSFDKGGLVAAGLAGLLALPSFASGGAVPIMAHPGEFVMRSAAVQSVGHGALSEVNRTGKFPEGGGQAGGPIHLHITHDYTNAVAPSDLKTKRKEVETYIIENWRKGGAVRTMIMGDKGRR